MLGFKVSDVRFFLSWGDVLLCLPACAAPNIMQDDAIGV